MNWLRVRGNRARAVIARLRNGVAAKAELYKVIADLAQSGIGVLVVSSENEELLGLCSRILVMREGEIVAELDAATATEQELLRHAVAPTDSSVLAEEVS